MTKTLFYWIAGSVALSGLFLSPAASAQESSPTMWDGKGAWSYCWWSDSVGVRATVVQPFQGDTEKLIDDGGRLKWAPKDEDLLKALSPDGRDIEFAMCSAFRTKDEAEAAAAKHATYLDAQLVSFQPSSNLAGPIKTLVLPFRRAEPYKQEGFAEAQISLSYRLMICAGEVQIAYGLDRNSLKTSDIYFTLQKGVLQSGPAPRAIAPTTVELDGVVSVGNSDYVVARFKDAIAGESLGYDCFSGQTKGLGAVAKLVPANVRGNPAATRSWLTGLNLQQAFHALPTVLRSTATTTDGVEPEAKAEPSRPSPDSERTAVEEREKLRQLNAENAARAKADSDAIAASKAKYSADQAAYKAKLAETQAATARYDAEMRTHDAAIADYQRQRAEYEAKVKAMGKQPE